MLHCSLYCVRIVIRKKSGRFWVFLAHFGRTVNYRNELKGELCNTVPRDSSEQVDGNVIAILWD